MDFSDAKALADGWIIGETPDRYGVYLIARVLESGTPDEWVQTLLAIYDNDEYEEDFGCMLPVWEVLPTYEYLDHTEGRVYAYRERPEPPRPPRKR